MPGSHEVIIDSLDKEPPSFQKTLGAMGALTLKLSLTNLALTPRGAVMPPKATVYWCVLTRIDSVECTDGSLSFTVGADRVVHEKTAGDFAALRKKVALALGEVPKAEQVEPDDPAVTPGDSDTLVPEDGIAPPVPRDG